MRSSSTLTLACLVLACPALAQDLSRATPESVGLASAGLERATAALEAHIDAGHVAGVVAAVARDGKLVYFEALGQRDLQHRDPMPDDALFRLYSMTRSITSTAVMVLWEEDRFEIDDPISRYLPQFADQRVFVDAREPDMSRTRARSGDITVRNLLTHTSGIGSRSSPIYRGERVRLRSITLREMVDNAAHVPLFEDPGTCASSPGTRGGAGGAHELTEHLFGLRAHHLMAARDERGYAGDAGAGRQRPIGVDGLLEASLLDDPPGLVSP